ncbi:uncharacterized protein LOC122086242 isoform X2 [Macadamia integrifolia]|uniref:uncharacterized protein LOC122086242 isoform X2 n=1 Tax=Macadamia integrifolia TaxID=60698 RepID=UPI001C500AA1|nr:uncharacterized protein LOC122086242 isoform X2 [Macadamia integrifolia]
MSIDWKEACNLGGLWTNEKHWNFLNSIEATFVSTMVENGGLMYLHPPLDRYIPDRSDSTLDLQSHRNSRRKRVYFPVGVDVLHPNTTSDDAGTEECNKRRSRQPRDASEDQVVPQVSDTKADKINCSDEEVAVTDEKALSASPLDRKTS